MELLDRHRDGIDLLHELRADRLAQRPGTGTRNKSANVVGRNVLKLVPNRHEQLHDLFGLARFMTLVVGPEDFLRCRIDDDRFDGRRADVNAENDTIAL